MTNTLEDILSRERGRLFGLAYRILGSAADAEDILQEAFLRARETPTDALRSPEAYLATVVTRLCIDLKRSARARRESYIGPWLPEPIATRSDTDPVERVENISHAFLIVLETLTPLARAAYVLREVFGYDYDVLASVLDRDEQACRQLVSRAKADLAARRPRFAPSREEHQSLVERFVDALQTGDIHGLERLLASQVTAVADGGGLRGVARIPVVGSAKVALYFSKLMSARYPSGARLTSQIAEVNGWPGLLGFIDGRLFFAMQFETDGIQIVRVATTVNPEKLAALRSGTVFVEP